MIRSLRPDRERGTFTLSSLCFHIDYSVHSVRTKNISRRTYHSRRTPKRLIGGRPEIGEGSTGTLKDRGTGRGAKTETLRGLERVDGRVDGRSKGFDLSPRRQTRPVPSVVGRTQRTGSQVETKKENPVAVLPRILSTQRDPYSSDLVVEFFSLSGTFPPFLFQVSEQ